MEAPIVIFGLAGQRLALPANAVRECLPLPELVRRPGSPASVAGFFALGSATLAVIDLAVLLGLRQPGETAPAEQDGLYRPLLRLDGMALLVDRLEQVALPDDAGEDADDDPWQHNCVSRRLRAGGAVVAVLDPARLLLADERARLDALAEQAAARARDWHAVDAPHAG